jgi:glycosyltransferase involved in cell wall biosynthesis
MKIKILTTSIQHKISGGTIFNAKLQAYFNQYSQTTIELIEQIETYTFDKNLQYIIDGILISEIQSVERLKDYSVSFLIHLWPSVFALNELQKYNLAQAERAICENFHLILTGENSKKHIEETLQTKFNGLIISPGVNNYWKQKKIFSPLPKKIIYLSNFIENKGHFRLIEVLSFIKTKEIEIDCYGEILSKNYHDKFLDAKPENINFKGTVAHQDVNELLLEYDLLVHFSDYESFGMGILEAIATNLPVIITPIGNFKNDKNFKFNGILNSFEPRIIATHLDEICTSKDKYHSLIQTVSAYSVTTWEENFKPLLAKFQLQ